jgi:hypothetical protein
MPHLSAISGDIRTIGRALVSIAAKLEKAPPLTAPAASTVDRRRPRATALKLSPKRRAALKLQGQYIGHTRLLSPRDKARVKALRLKKGVQAAIALARRLSAQ